MRKISKLNITVPNVIIQNISEIPNFVFLVIFVEKTNKRKVFSEHPIVLVWCNDIMVYSNALYFASQFDKLTDEVLSTFNAKEKSQKTPN